MADAGDRVADIERRWSKLVGVKNYAQMSATRRCSRICAMSTTSSA